jgi:hypothetical protein
VVFAPALLTSMEVRGAGEQSIGREDVLSGGALERRFFFSGAGDSFAWDTIPEIWQKTGTLHCTSSYDHCSLKILPCCFLLLRERRLLQVRPAPNDALKQATATITPFCAIIIIIIIMKFSGTIAAAAVSVILFTPFVSGKKRARNNEEIKYYNPK